MRELTRQVKKWLREHAIGGDCEEAGVIVGVSGGADSVCLLAVLAELAADCGLRLAAVHVNHGIRGEEAAEDERFVRELCSRLKIPCAVFARDVPALASASGQTLEEAGRKVRYEIFERERQARAAAWIAVAHHREDQAETVLLHLFRGSGLRGAGGMRPVQGRIIRPLFDVSRAQIEMFLRERGLKWREDSTNGETDAARNFLRLEILPALRSRWPDVTGALCRAAAHFAAADDYLREEAGRFLQKAERREADGGFSLPVSDLLRLPQALQAEVLRAALAQASGDERDLTARHVEALLCLCEGQSGRQLDFPRGLAVKKSYDRLLFGGGIRETPGGLPVSSMRIVSAHEAEKIAENDCTKCFAYDKINKLPAWRYRQPGDRIALYADGRGKKLQDFFTDRKIPAERRGKIALLALEKEILWVPGLRVSEAFRVTKQTARVLVVTISGWDRITEG